MKMSQYFKKIIISSVLIICNSEIVQGIPAEQIFMNSEKLEYLGGAWIPLTEKEAKYGGNLDEGSYWYELNKYEEKIYLTLQKLEGRTEDGKAIFQSLDVIEIPELMNQNQYGIMRGLSDNCWYPNNQIFQDSKILMVVKYNTDTATPIRSFRANLTTEKWEIPPASTIKGLICEVYQP